MKVKDSLGREFSVYLNNPRLKSVDCPVSLTEAEIQEYLKCAQDPIHFIRNYIKIVNVDEGVIPFRMWDFQEKMVETYSQNRFCVTLCSRQVGKALDISTPILTTGGWKTMGELEVGDSVYGRDGKPTKITFTSPVYENRNCYRITFDNGESIVADEEHLWTVDRAKWSSEKTMTTAELISLRNETSNDQPVKVKILQNPIEFESTDKLDIDPYVLGLWLGDGTSATSSITCHELDYEHYKNVIKGISPFKEKIQRFKVEGLFSLLRTNNLLNNKHIPEKYIYTTVENRLQLIRGLMDSDGWCHKENGRTEFYNKNKGIVDSFVLILSTLGIKSRVREKIISGQTYYIVRFCTHFDVFTLPRKLERQKNFQGHQKNFNYYIKDIEKVNSVPVKCIGVDNEDKLYLAGKTLIPTHNSTVVVSYLLWVILFQDNKNCCILAHKGATSRELLARLKDAYELLPLWMQQGVKVWNKGSIELENGSKVMAAATSSSSIRGQSFNIIQLDEFAFVPNNMADEFFASVYPTIASGKTTQVIIVSTPNGMNHFYKIWVNANKQPGEQGKNDYVPIKVLWHDVPGRDEEWKRQTIANTSDRQFRQEQESVSGDTSINVVKDGLLQKITIAELYEELQKLQGNKS